jgi:hypothetical protein
LHARPYDAALASGTEPWDTQWAAERAAAALRYLGTHYPECAGSEALREHEEAAHEAATDGDEVSIPRSSPRLL